MQHLPEVLRSFGRLLSYPEERTLESAEFLYVALQAALPDAAREVSRFADLIEQSAASDLEEAYTTTFDVNPACALEVGWHLFGEEYARGQFLVRMREELRNHGIDESAELPDHLSHVLAVVAAMGDDERARFVGACVLPALEKMQAALEATDSPYGGVLRSLIQVMEHHWQNSTRGASEDDARSRGGRSPAEGVDLLHAYPVADAPFFNPMEESGCQSAFEIVPLQTSFHTEAERAPAPRPTTHSSPPTTER